MSHTATIAYNWNKISILERGNDSLKRFFRYHLPVTVYAALIIAISSIPHLKAPKIIFFQFDKAAHFLEYALLAFLTYRSSTHLSSRMTRHRSFLISAVFVAIFAALDELYQRTVPGRDSALGDLSMDLIGAALVLILLWYRGKTPNSGLLQDVQ